MIHGSRSTKRNGRIINKQVLLGLPHVLESAERRDRGGREREERMRKGEGKLPVNRTGKTSINQMDVPFAPWIDAIPSSATSEEVSNPNPKRNPKGYIFQGRSMIWKTFLRHHTRHPPPWISNSSFLSSFSPTPPSSSFLPRISASSFRSSSKSCCRCRCNRQCTCRCCLCR